MRVEELNPNLYRAEDGLLLSSFHSGSLSLRGTSTIRAKRALQHGFNPDVDKTGWKGMSFTLIKSETDSAFGPLGEPLSHVLYDARSASQWERKNGLDSEPAVLLILTPDKFTSLNGAPFANGIVPAERFIDYFQIPQDQMSQKLEEGVNALRETLMRDKIKIQQRYRQLGIPLP